MSTRVCLINPPGIQHIRADYSDMIEKGTGIYPPLGLLYLSSACKRRNFDVSLIDCPAQRLNYAEAAQKAESYRPGVIGVTCMTFNLPDVLELVKELKKRYPLAPVVIGGPHATIFPRELLNFPYVDVVVCGEGEEVFPEVVDRLIKNTSLEGLPGVGYKSAGGVHISSEIATVQKLDSLMFPDTSPFADRYFTMIGKGDKVTIMMTGRGCPYRCIYCDRPAMGKRYRARSAENVVREIEGYLLRGIKEIMFFDDTFTLDRDRVIKICELIQEKKLRFRWSCRARVDTVDLELLIKMRKAGCRRISYGIESGNPDVLEALKKGTSLEKVADAVQQAKRAGIEVYADFIIGSPGENKKTILQTIDFAISLDVDYAQFTIMSLFPGTEIYQMALSRGLIPTDVWKDFATNPHPRFNTPIWPGELTQRELEDLLLLAYRRFYGRPAHIIKLLKRTRSFKEISLKARAGWKVLTFKKLMKRQQDEHSTG